MLSRHRHGSGERVATDSECLADSECPAEDRQAIVDLCIRYTLALDSRDWASLRECFAETATAHYEGRDDSVGYEAIEATCRTALEPLRASQHLLGNHLVTLKGDEADGVCYFQAQHVRDGMAGGSTFMVAGRYDDHFVRSEAGWRIAARRLSVTWTSGNESILAPASPAIPLHIDNSS